MINRDRIQGMIKLEHNIFQVKQKNRLKSTDVFIFYISTRDLYTETNLYFIVFIPSAFTT